MKINWKVRIKNPYFWIGIFGVIMAGMGVSPEMFTSWDMILTQLKELFGNPYLLGSIIFSVIGVIFDPTTKGLCDSQQARTYEKPRE